jgi:hypothetical protein
MSDSIAAPTLPLQNILPAYPYQQYADDVNICAFFTAYNTIASSYLAWQNQVPWSVYTNAGVNGPLLDWIGQGIYGIPRPVFSTLATFFRGAALDAVPLDTIAIDGSSISETGTAITATDDYYKRVLTWFTYIGDGQHFNAMVLRRKIARFLYGVNGTDITLSQVQTVSIAVQTTPTLEYIITIPSAANPASLYFQDAYNSGVLMLPFMVAATVNIV